MFLGEPDWYRVHFKVGTSNTAKGHPHLERNAYWNGQQLKRRVKTEVLLVDMVTGTKV